MKKKLAFLTAVCIMATLSGCGDKAEKNEKSTTTTSAVTTTTTSAATTTATKQEEIVEEPSYEELFEGVTMENFLHTLKLVENFELDGNYGIHYGITNDYADKVVLDAVYNGFGVIDEKGIGYVLIGDESSVLVDVENKTLIELDFDLSSYGKGYFIGSKNGKYGIVDMNLETVVDFTYDYPIRAYYSDGYIVCENENGLEELYDKDGNPVFEGEYKNIYRGGKYWQIAPSASGEGFDFYDKDFNFLFTKDRLYVYYEEAGVYTTYGENHVTVVTDEDFNVLFTTDNMEIPLNFMSDGRIMYRGIIYDSSFNEVSKADRLIQSSIDVIGPPNYFGYTIKNGDVISYYGRGDILVFEFEAEEYYLDSPGYVIRIISKEADGWHVYDEYGREVLTDDIPYEYTFEKITENEVVFRNESGETVKYPHSVE